MPSDFPMNETSTFDDNIRLKLTEWELANLHLPPVTTVTLYEGSAPLAFLRKRLAVIFKKNPWLAPRIVKKTTANGVVALAYSTKLFVVCSPCNVRVKNWQQIAMNRSSRLQWYLSRQNRRAMFSQCHCKKPSAFLAPGSSIDNAPF
jgi:hypothetical protein